MATIEATNRAIDRTTDIPLVQPVAEKFQYPGIPTTCDGAEAVVWVETRISQGCGAYPITSSTTMGGGFNQATVNGRASSLCLSSRRASILRRRSARASRRQADG
jgi:hypothetical protein